MDRVVAGAHTRLCLRRGAVPASIRGPERRYHAYAAAVRRTPAQQLLLCRLARATRQRFPETFADSPAMIIPAHFPTPSAGWIRSHDGSFRFHFDRLR